MLYTKNTLFTKRFTSHNYTLSLPTMGKNEWFASWFDTHYYHLLYRNRDLEEARLFIERLVAKLEIPENSTALDLACGKGRHALNLAEQGLQVLGADLSEQSIAKARTLEHDNLSFKVHDMREALPERFDYIFNLFTSFGYFDSEEENERVLHVIHQMLKPDGVFVFDFLNQETTLNGLVEKEEQEIDGVEFYINRNFDGRILTKSIDINDQGKVFHFEEKVRAYSYSELASMMERADFEISNTFGNFLLQPFREKTADRVIFTCKRKRG